MGGFGSGRYEYATTPTVEDCRQLDVDNIKEFTEHLGSRGPVWWGDREDPAAWITVEAVDERELGDETRAGGLKLTYTITDGATDETENLEYTVPLEYTECHFGGYRPWFRCPGVVDGQKCGRRARKLYLPLRRGTRYYLCRECYDLGYTTSRTSGDELKQAELRYRRAFAKADKDNRRPHPNSIEATLPERPKGMHYDTFDALLDEVHAAREEWDRAMNDRMRELTGRLEDAVGYRL